MASTSFHLNMRVESFEFDAGIGGREVPIDLT